MKKLICFMLTAILFVGCSSTKINGERLEIPKWALNEPESKEYVFAVGNAKCGSDISIAYDMAFSKAKANLMQKVKSESSDKETTSVKVGSDGKPESLYKRETSHNSEMNLNNVIVEKKHYSKDGTVWVLVKIPKKTIF